MKNSIFKSYSKRILRNEAFISVIVVFVLALGIIGTSYALYMDVDTDTDYQLVEVGDLKIDFDNVDNSTNPEDYSKITLSNMVPMEDEIGTTETDNIFSFRIYNTGTYTVDYDIKLVTADGNEVDTKYINFQLCKDDASNCGDVQTLSNIKDSIIREDHISPAREGEDASVYYFIRLWINNQYPLDTTTNTNIVLRVLIEANNASGYLDNDNTLAGAILNNDKIKINNTTPTFTGIATEEEGIYKAQDDYGTSYYFRGAQSNNYVNFAGFTWRVVRINGDGSIRLILNDVLNSSYRKNEDGTQNENKAGTTTAFQDTNYADNAYIGYMTGIPNSDNYNDTHKNINDSSIKKVVDTFYETYIENDSNNYHYEKYLADSIFCGDKTLANNTIGTNNTVLGYGINKTYYAAVERLYYSEGTTSITKVSPTLECAKSAPDSYSRYTSSLDESTTTSKDVIVNNDLKYPIALLSADELIMAGAFYITANQNYYLNISSAFWTMTPYSGGELAILMSSGINGKTTNQTEAYDGIGVRPVINLKANTLLDSGDGTSTNPYTIKYN